MSDDVKPTITMTINLPEPSTEQVVAAMAERLLGAMYEYDTGDPDEIAAPTSSYDRKQIGKQLRLYLDKKVAALAESLVREQFDAEIKSAIKATVDEVLDEGWYKTDSYGGRRGDKLTLKDRVGELLTEETSEGYNNPRLSRAARIAKDVIDKTLREEFGKELESARAKFREQLDGVVAAKFAETIKAALGLR